MITDLPRSAHAVQNIATAIDGLNPKVDMRGHRLDPGMIISSTTINSLELMDTETNDVTKKTATLSSILVNTGEIKDPNLGNDSYFTYGMFPTEEGENRMLFVGKMVATTSKGTVWIPHTAVTTKILRRRRRFDSAVHVKASNLIFVPYVRPVGVEGVAYQPNVVTGNEDPSLLAALSGIDDWVSFFRPLKTNYRTMVQGFENSLHEKRYGLFSEDEAGSAVGRFNFGGGVEEPFRFDLSRLMKVLSGNAAMEEQGFTDSLVGGGKSTAEQLPGYFLPLLYQDSIIAVGYETGVSSKPNVETLRIDDRKNLVERFPAIDDPERTFSFTATPFMGRPIRYEKAKAGKSVRVGRLITARPLLITGASRYSIQPDARGFIDASHMHLPNIGYSVSVTYDSSIMNMGKILFNPETYQLELDRVEDLRNRFEGDVKDNVKITMNFPAVEEIQYNELSMLGDEKSLCLEAFPMNTDNVGVEFNDKDKSPFMKARFSENYNDKRMINVLEKIKDDEKFIVKGDGSVSQATIYGSIAVQEALNDLVNRFMRKRGAGRDAKDASVFPFVSMSIGETPINLEEKSVFNFTKVSFVANEANEYNGYYTLETTYGTTEIGPILMKDLVLKVDLNLNDYISYFARVRRRGVVRPNVGAQSLMREKILPSFRYLLASLCSLQHDMHVYRSDDSVTLLGGESTVDVIAEGLGIEEVALCDAVSIVQNVTIEAVALESLFAAPKQGLNVLASGEEFSMGGGDMDFVKEVSIAYHRSRKQSVEEAFSSDGTNPPPSSMFVHQYQINAGNVLGIEGAGDVLGIEGTVAKAIDYLYRNKASMTTEEREEAIVDYVDEGEGHAEEGPSEEEVRREEEAAERVREEERRMREEEEAERVREEERKRREEAERVLEEERKRREEAERALEEERKRREEEERKRREEAERVLEEERKRREEANARLEAEKRRLEEEQKEREAEEKRQRELDEQKRLAQEKLEEFAKQGDELTKGAKRAEKEANEQRIREEEEARLAEEEARRAQEKLDRLAEEEAIIREALEQAEAEERARLEEEWERFFEERARAEEEAKRKEEEAERQRREAEETQRREEEERLRREEELRIEKEKLDELQRKKEEADAALEEFTRERLEKEKERKAREDKWWEDENAWRASQGLPPLQRKGVRPLPIPPSDVFAKVTKGDTLSGKVIRGVVSKIERFAIPLRPYAPRKRSFMSTMEQMDWRLGRLHASERVYRGGLGVHFVSFDQGSGTLSELVSDENTATYRKLYQYTERRLISSTKHLGERSVVMSAIGATFGKKTGKPFRETSRGPSVVNNLRKVPISGILQVFGYTDRDGETLAIPMDYTFFPKMNTRSGSVEGRIFSVNDRLSREKGKPIPVARVHVKARMNADGKTCTILSLVVAISQNLRSVRNVIDILVSTLEDSYRGRRFEESLRIVRPPAPKPRPSPKPRIRPPPPPRKETRTGIESPFPRPTIFLPQERTLPEVSSINSLLEASERLARNLEALADLVQDEEGSSNTIYDDADRLRNRINRAIKASDRYDALAATLEDLRAKAREQGTLESVRAVEEAYNAILAEWESEGEDDWGPEIRELQGQYRAIGNRYADLYENEMLDAEVPALGGIPLGQVTFLAPRFTETGFFPQKAAFIDELSKRAGYYTMDEYDNKLTGKPIPNPPDNAKPNWNEPPTGYKYNTLESMGRVVVFYTRQDNIIFAPTDLETPMTLGTDPSRYAFVNGSYYRIAPPFPPPGLGGDEGKGKQRVLESKIYKKEEEEEEEWMLL